MAVSTCFRLDDDAYHWLVLHIRVLSLQLAEQSLGDRQVQTYCPYILAPPWHRRAPRRPIPLFPGYLFVYCNVAESFDTIRFCPGVIRPVMFEHRLATVGQDVVDALRDREEGRGYILPDSEAGRLAEGQRVMVGGGPMRGLEGAFLDYVRGGQRAQILIDFLRSQRQIEVDIASLTPIHD